MLKIGFTGTRRGMTPAQLRSLRQIFQRICDRRAPDDSGATKIKDVEVEVHQGDCEGSDHECHILALAFGFDVVVHPPTDNKHRACRGRGCKYGKEVRTPRDYLSRNHSIVDGTMWLISTPKENAEPMNKRGGGTWATVRYGAGELASRQPPGDARKVIVIMPDGLVKRREAA